MHSHTLSAGVEPLHDGVLLGRLLLLGEEVGLRDVVRQRRFRHVDLLTLCVGKTFYNRNCYWAAAR